MVHYLFLPWNLPWIILACYGKQQQQQKKKKQSIIPRSDAVVCDIWSGRTLFGNSFVESGTDKLCWSKQKTGAFKRCILLSLSVKWPLIFLDTSTASGCFAVSLYSHVSHKRINIIRLPLRMIRVNRLFTAQRSVKCWFFDNVWIMT